MILWLILFLLIIGISFILALRSMKDYQEIPEKAKAEYGLFLIRQTENFDADVLNSIGKFILDKGLIISVERLFKGSEAALTIFGPKEILDKFSQSLNLLELEDYMYELDTQDIAIWELGIKSSKNLQFDNPNNIFKNLSELGKEDQFFWQVILGARKDKEDLLFQTQIRAAIYCKDPVKMKTLVALLQNLKLGELTKVPQPFSAEQMMGFFKQRSLSKDSNGPILTADGIMSLLRI